MSTAPPELALPTLTRLNAVVPEDVDPKAIASQWFSQFARHLESGSVEGITDLLLHDAFWRDTLALTWDFRTFYGVPKIARFLQDVLSSAPQSPESKNNDRIVVSKLVLDETSVSLQTPYPDLSWIQSFFSFETVTGIASGVLRLVPTSSGTWKAHVVYTNLEELKGFPELVGSLRSTAVNHGDDWLAERKRESSFEDTEPVVVVVGAGHCGLEVAARLKYLGVPTLVVERYPRIGDSWRIRYEALSLHDPVYVIHMPYLPQISFDLATLDAIAQADWLEFYVEALELNVWTSTNVENITECRNSSQNAWEVHVERNNGEKNVLKPKHVIFATGMFGGSPRIPTFLGTENFKGKIIHSTEYKTAREHDGKKVVIIGACTSGHDVAQDYAKKGIDVTMVQRGSTYIMSTKYGVTKFNKGLYWEGTPPPDVSDKIGSSFPRMLTKLLHQRQAPEIAEMDKDLLDGLKMRGFRFNMGEDDSGVIMLYLRRGGGFYFDTGASQMIVDGRIKLKNDSIISRFTEDGIDFDNGTSLPADVVILATGYESARDYVCSLVSQDVANRLYPVWDLDDEWESNSVYRYSGVPGLYFAMGNFQSSRFHSKLLALQIKAQEEGLFGNRYHA